MRVDEAGHDEMRPMVDDFRVDPLPANERREVADCRDPAVTQDEPAILEIGEGPGARLARHRLVVEGQDASAQELAGHCAALPETTP